MGRARKGGQVCTWPWPPRHLGRPGPAGTPPLHAVTLGPSALGEPSTHRWGVMPEAPMTPQSHPGRDHTLGSCLPKLCSGEPSVRLGVHRAELGTLGRNLQLEVCTSGHLCTARDHLPPSLAERQGLGGHGRSDQPPTPTPTARLAKPLQARSPWMECV